MWVCRLWPHRQAQSHFFSALGQAYSDGLRFVQFYFGLPLAMIVLCTTFIPIFKNLNVYTAYEFLEKRFDIKTRTLTAFFFLLQRGLSTGITIYAPAIVLSTILNLDVFLTTILMGLLVIFYTVYGGTKAVSYTQVLQMGIIFSGLFVAGSMVVHLLPENVGFTDALHIAGKMNRLNAIDLSFDWNNRYNIWSGLIGGFFLQLSYFGTDQSQVGRYLTGKSTSESRLGLIMNGLIKIPMQFLILLIGTLVFSFYQFYQPPVFFNKTEIEKIRTSQYHSEFELLEAKHSKSVENKKKEIFALVDAIHSGDKTETDRKRETVRLANEQTEEIRKEVIALLKQNNPKADMNDSNYVFLRFVMDQFPTGLVGLLIAIIFLASMVPRQVGLIRWRPPLWLIFTSAFVNNEAGEKNDLKASRWLTMIWGLFCISVALFAARLGNLIEAVNILGSLFYGTILGVFLTAFFLKKVGGNAVFLAAVITEILVVFAWLTDQVAFLWLNVAGACLVLVLGLLFSSFPVFNQLNWWSTEK